MLSTFCTCPRMRVRYQFCVRMRTILVPTVSFAIQSFKTGTVPVENVYTFVMNTPFCRLIIFFSFSRMARSQLSLKLPSVYNLIKMNKKKERSYTLFWKYPLFMYWFCVNVLQNMKMQQLQDWYVIHLCQKKLRFCIAQIVSEKFLLFRGREGERQRFVSQCDLYARSFRVVQSGLLKVNVPPVPSRVHVIRRQRERLYITLRLYGNAYTRRLDWNRYEEETEPNWSHMNETIIMRGDDESHTLRWSLNCRRGREEREREKYFFFLFFPLGAI